MTNLDIIDGSLCCSFWYFCVRGYNNKAVRHSVAANCVFVTANANAIRRINSSGQDEWCELYILIIKTSLCRYWTEWNGTERKFQWIYSTLTFFGTDPILYFTYPYTFYLHYALHTQNSPKINGFYKILQHSTTLLTIHTIYFEIF